MPWKMTPPVVYYLVDFIINIAVNMILYSDVINKIKFEEKEKTVGSHSHGGHYTIMVC